MSDTITVHFTKDLIARMVSATEVQTIRLAEMGIPNEDGSYSPTWIVEDLVPDLPGKWVFDGYRRIYDEGKVLPLWQARAVDLTAVEFEEGTGRAKVNFVAGQGKTLVEARDVLLEQLETA